jgi:hypothetical protein
LAAPSIEMNGNFVYVQYNPKINAKCKFEKNSIFIPDHQSTNKVA